MLLGISNILLLIFGHLLTHSNSDHGIYISVIEITNTEVSGEGEITIKSFSDDLLNALRGMDSSIPQSADPCGIISSVEEYVKLHLKVNINELPIELKISNCQIENDTHWIYLNYALDQELSKVKIEIDWFTELFTNQSNIVKVSTRNGRKNARLNKENQIATLEF